MVEVKPGRAISIIETDVNVDFAPPKDMAEDDARHPNSASVHSTTTGGSGGSMRKSSSSQLPASRKSSERKDGGGGEEFVFHAGQDATQEKFFEHDNGGLHEGNAILKDSEDDKKGNYFAKLSGGHRLNAKKTGTTPTTTPTPSTTHSRPLLRPASHYPHPVLQPLLALHCRHVRLP